MKRTNSFFMASFAAFISIATAHAQDVAEYYPVGTKWIEETFFVMHTGGELRFGGTYRKCVVDGDSNYNGKKYKHVSAYAYEIKNDIDEYYRPEDPSKWKRLVWDDVLIREEGKKVYYIPYNEKKEILIYDYDWFIGKMIPYNYISEFDEYQYYKIDEIFNMQDITAYEYVIIPDISMSRKYMQIKGIGFVQPWNGIFNPGFEPPFSIIYYIHKVIGFWRNGQLIYKSERPRPEDFDTGIDHAECDATAGNVKIYNLQGMEIKADGTKSLPKGIYISKGKKIMVK